MSIVTLHAQGYEDWLRDFLAASGAKWIKFVNVFPQLEGVNIIGRVHVAESISNPLVAQGEAGANTFFFDHVLAEMNKNRHVTIWEGPNEVSFWYTAILAGYEDFYQRLIYLYHYYGFKIMAGQINTGWPLLPEDDGGAQSAIIGRAIQGADGVSFHEYDPLDLRSRPGYNMLRLEKTVDYWRSLGLTVPPVFVTECGLDRPDSTAPMGHWGWKTITSNNLPLYIEQLCWYEQQLQALGYVESATVFSVITNWDDFALDRDQSMQLADALAKIAPPLPVERARLLDVNMFSGDINFPLVKADGYVGVLIRFAGPNADRTAFIVDPNAEKYYNEAGAAGLLRGGYCGVMQNETGQAGIFVDAVGGRPLELGYWGDFEGEVTDTKANDFLIAADRNLARWEVDPPVCHVYTSIGWLSNKEAAWAEGRDLWLAAWTYDPTVNPTIPAQWAERGWKLWQWSNKGTDVPGIPNRVCLDVYNGSNREFYQEYAPNNNGGDMWNSVGFEDVELVGVTKEDFDAFWGMNMKRLVPAELPVGSTYYKLTRLSWREGWCGLSIKVVDEYYNAIEGEQVFQGWKDGPQLPDNVAPIGGQPDGYPNKGHGGFTNADGVHGWGWGEGEWFDPTVIEGPHWYWRGGEGGAYSDVVCGFGWYDDHEVLEPTLMRIVIGDEPNPPNPDDDLTKVVEAIDRNTEQVSRLADAVEALVNWEKNRE